MSLGKIPFGKAFLIAKKEAGEDILSKGSVGEWANPASHQLL